MNIDKLIKSTDPFYLELLETKSELPRSIFETYSAFANSEGGIILLGLKDISTDKRFDYEIVGIENPDEYIAEFWKILNDPKQVSYNLLTKNDIQIIEIENKKIIVIEVPAASYHEKPIFLYSNLYSGTYLRSNSKDVKANRDLVEEFLRDAKDYSYDSELVENYTFDDIDSPTLENYRKQFNKIHSDSKWNQLKPEAFLENIGGIARDRKTGERWLTVAGLLMFGKGLSVREYFDLLPMEYRNPTITDIRERQEKNITIDGSWENNLYNYLNLTIAKIREDLDLTDENGDLLLLKAFYEVIKNMLIHADYKIWGALRISKINNTFTFSNPGSFKVTTDEIFSGKVSKARNPKIKQMLDLIDSSTNESGFKSVLEVLKKRSYRKPELKYNEKRNQVEIKISLEPLTSNELEDKLAKLFPISSSKFSEIERLILISVIVENQITATRLNDLLDTDYNKIVKSLNKLVENEYLEFNNLWDGDFYSLNPNKIETEQKKQRERTTSSLTNFVNLNLTESEAKIVEYLKSNPFITNQEVIQITKITTRQGAHKVLTRLVNKRILTRRKEGKSNLYTLK